MAQKKAKKRGKKLMIELSEDAMTATEALGKITKRKIIEVASDAFRIYMWILFEQTFGGVINARHSESAENRELENLVRDQKTAEKYLKNFRHLMRRDPAIFFIQQD